MSRLRGAGWVLMLVMGLTLTAGPARSRDGGSTLAQVGPKVAGPVTIEAAGRGGPWVNLTDGRPVPTEFPAGSHAAAKMTDRSVQPRSLAAADFDEDGVFDLVCGFATDEGGLLTLHRGNIDAIYQDAPQARARRAAGTFVDAPFLPQVDLVEVSAKPDYLAAGDFDADGHWDIAFSAQGGASILVNFGDGTGHFAETETIALPGAVTAMTAGEINRRDGLDDIVVGIDGEDGPRALVFEGPEGALRAAPESIPLTAPAIDLALERLDDTLHLDLAIATARGITVVQGRDRRLSHPEERRKMIGDPIVRRFDMPFTIAAMTTGDFDGDRQIDLALLDGDGAVHVARPDELSAVANGLGRPPRPLALAAAALQQDAVSGRRVDGRRAVRLLGAQVSSLPGDDLLVVDSSFNPIKLLLPTRGNASSALAREGGGRSASDDAPDPIALDGDGAPVAVLPMRLNRDALSDLVVLSEAGPATQAAGLSIIETDAAMTFTVMNTNATGPGSLDQAILDANTNPGADTIEFDIPGAGPHTIGTIGLPTITEALTIDGTTEPDYAGTPVVEIDGTLAPSHGLAVNGAPATIRGLAINRAAGGFGIDLVLSDAAVIEGNFIGTDVTGTSAAGNAHGGINHLSTTNTLIGGTTSAARNVISGHSMGNGIYGFNAPGMMIRGNYIGTDRTGNLAVPNAAGIYLGGPEPIQIGGTTSGAGNVISGNLYFGIDVDPTAPGNLVQGNHIGINAGGTAPLGHGQSGIVLDSAFNTIGGTVPGARNLIGSNSGHGIRIDGPVPEGNDNTIQGNYIGVDLSGTIALGNGLSGIYVWTESNLIGGSTGGARNVISGNGSFGVLIEPYALGTDVLGNYIGTTASGFASLGNGLDGVLLGSADARIGGPGPLLNLISGNLRDGIRLYDGLTFGSNVVEVNLIGVDADGQSALPNGGYGILLQDREGDQIGIRLGEGNVISGNQLGGVLIENSSGISLRGNLIGLDVNGTGIVPNGGSGVEIRVGTGNSIGGDLSEAGNVIAGNLGNGILLAQSHANEIYNNIIGLDSVGVAAPNGANGIDAVGSSQNTIGDLSAFDRGNTISGNGANGILLRGGSQLNDVRANRIGVDSAGVSAIPNGGDGVRIEDSLSNTIGGADPAAANAISGNGGSGVVISASTAIGNNAVLGNYIGTDPALSLDLGNGYDGVTLLGATVDNRIGDAGPLDGNYIGFNARGGIQAYDTGINTFRGNDIFLNGQLGIDLGGDGVTANDPGDTDTGPNGLLNFPVITSAITSLSAPFGLASISGTLDGPPGLSFDIDYFAASVCDPLFGHGEADFYLGRSTVTTDASGHTDLFREITGMLSGWNITATASHPSIGTSELSQCTLAADGPPPAVMGVSWSEDGTTLSWSGMLAAETYSVYEGGPADLPNLLDPDPDSCLLYSGPASMTTVDVSSGNPPLGSMFWQVVRAGDSVSGEGSAGEATAGPRMQDSTGDCQYCAHNRCQIGGPLQETCSPCVAAICAQNPTCCTDQWDVRCAMDVLNVCGSFACQPLGTCTHSFCQTGEALQPGCDSPPLQPSCVDRICASFPNCCGGPLNLWTSQCASAVEPLCGLSCD